MFSAKFKGNVTVLAKSSKVTGRESNPRLATEAQRHGGYEREIVLYGFLWGQRDLGCAALTKFKCSRFSSSSQELINVTRPGRS